MCTKSQFDVTLVHMCEGKENLVDHGDGVGRFTDHPEALLARAIGLVVQELGGVVVDPVEPGIVEPPAVE